MSSKSASRLERIKNQFLQTGSASGSKDKMVWDPEQDSFPLRKDLPKIPGAPDDAAWFWGEDDFKGRLNLLTAKRTKEASKEIRTGERITVK